MTKSKAFIALCSVLMLASLPATARAADATNAKPAVVITDVKRNAKVIGTVTVTGDLKSGLKSCELLGADGITYLCDPVSQWKTLSYSNGKLVECTGMTSVRNGIHRIYIKSIVQSKR